MVQAEKGKEWLVVLKDALVILKTLLRYIRVFLTKNAKMQEKVKME